MPVSRSKVDELSGIPWARRKLRQRKAAIPWLGLAEKTADLPTKSPQGQHCQSSQQRVANLEQGAKAEEQALRLLESEGLVLLTRNHRCKCGELDLIMASGNTAVVVEVRLRSNRRHGSALESISTHKQQRVSRCARLWWAQQGQRKFRHLRFDVVALESDSEPVWVQNAWQISN